MRSTSIHLVLLALLMGMAAAAQAYPTASPLWGISGLGAIPTADTVSSRDLQLGLGYENVDASIGGGGETVHLVPVVSATYGLGRAEVGAGYLHERVSAMNVTLDNNYGVLHGKFRVINNGPGGLAVAVGAHYFKPQNGDVASLYAVASEPILRRTGHLLRAHLGILYEHINLFHTANEIRPFAGLDFQCARGITLAGDYLPGSGAAQRIWSVIARYEAPAGWGAEIGYGKQKTEDRRLFFSISYRLGK